MPTAPPSPRGQTGRLWLGYFFAAIAVIGVPGFIVATPVMLAGRIWHLPRRLAVSMFLAGLELLMRAQPWLRANVQITSQWPQEPRRGTLYVSNHRSTLDVFFLIANIKGIRILAKRSLGYLPFLGLPMWLTRQVFVTQADMGDFSRAMRQVERGLRSGDAMHIFPEYRRCPAGLVGTQKFSVAPFQVAVATQARVVPIVFHGTDTAWPKGTYGLRYRTPVRVESLPPLDAGTYDNPRQLMQDVRARIDAALGVPP